MDDGSAWVDGCAGAWNLEELEQVINARRIAVRLLSLGSHSCLCTHIARLGLAVLLYPFYGVEGFFLDQSFLSSNMPPTLSSLPDSVLLCIIRHLCSPPRRHPPRYPLPHHPNAFPLAHSSSRILDVFKSRCLTTLDFVPNNDFLTPLPRSDPRFRHREPRLLRRLVCMAAAWLKELHLPMYDCSMEDAQWSVLADVAQWCPNLKVLTFVDSGNHFTTTVEDVQRTILEQVLPHIDRFVLYVVRQEWKLALMATIGYFMPKWLELHHVHPRLGGRVIDLLRRRGSNVGLFGVSFERVGVEAEWDIFIRRFLVDLAAVICTNMSRLSELRVVDAAYINPLMGLRGPGVGTTESRSEFARVRHSLKEVKRGEMKGLKRLVVGRVIEDLAAAVDVFAGMCGRETDIEVYLNEVVFVSSGCEENAEAECYFRATKLHSSSWMMKELKEEYFRRVEHIHVGLDEDCAKAEHAWFEKWWRNDRGGTPDMQGFAFLCKKSGGRVQSVDARVPVESVCKAKLVLRRLSLGFAYARNVMILQLSGDVLSFVGLEHALLYSVIGQLRNLRIMKVSEPSCGEYINAQMESLPVLIRGLWMFCERLESFEWELWSCGKGFREDCVREGLEALREFDRKLPGVETNGLEELLGIALRHCRGEMMNTTRLTE